MAKKKQAKAVLRTYLMMVQMHPVQPLTTSVAGATREGAREMARKAP